MSLKKNLNSLLKESPQKSLYFFDESRFGTHSNIGHGWFLKGSRTPIKVKLGFENFYAYSSINPMTGEDFSLILPYVNTECLNMFLAEMSKALGDKEVIMVIDGASWHKSQDLQVPPNIQIVYLPPYSPELNPVERLWQYIKSNTIKNKVYENLNVLEETICNFIKNFDREIIKSVCSFNY
jgi:transposase